MNRPLKVVIFVSALSAGGTERVAVRVAGWLQEAGHDVHLVTLASPHADFYDTPDGVIRVGFDLLRPSRGVADAVRSNLRRFSRLRGYVRHHRPDVVIALAEQANIVMLLALTGIRCGKIISERSDPAEARSWVWRLLRRITYPSATMHVSQSHYVSDWIARHFPGLETVVIGNTAGRAPQRRLPPPASPDGTLRLVAVARLSREKGLDILLHALALVRERGIPVTVVIAGDGVELPALRDQANELQLADSVTFAGAITDVFGLFAKADAFVMPSRLEGFPNAMIEAMTAGMPVIAARCPGGTLDVLGDEPGRYALEFPPGDAAQLAGAIGRLAKVPGLLDDLAEAAFQRAQCYDPGSIATAWRQAVAGAAACD